MNDLYIGIFLLVLFLLMDVILYAFKSASENINESYIEKKAEENNPKAIRLKKMMGKFSRFTDTLDIVVFGTNLISGAYILGVVRRMIAAEIKNNSVWITVAVGFVIFFILVIFGVLIPKKCGRLKPEKTAMAFSGAANGIVIILYPVTVAISFIAEMILRIFGMDPNANVDNVTEEEIITMVNEGQEQGVLEASEAEMITNIFELGDKVAGDIMSHRSSIAAVDCNISLEEFVQSQKQGKYSRFPVYDKDVDNIIGTIHIRDALVMYGNASNRKKPIIKLKGLLREAFLVPESVNINELLKDMQSEKVHIAIVVDEYGQTAGVVSMEDIIEEIVGNIMDEYDEETEIETYEDDTYVVEGLTRLEDLEKIIGVEIKSEEFDTLNGYLISKLNRIPEENETEEITADGYHFRILEVSQNVVRKVEITKVPEDEGIKDDKDTETEE